MLAYVTATDVSESRVPLDPQPSPPWESCTVCCALWPQRECTRAGSGPLWRVLGDGGLCWEGGRGGFVLTGREKSWCEDKLGGKSWFFKKVTNFSAPNYLFLEPLPPPKDRGSFFLSRSVGGYAVAGGLDVKISEGTKPPPPPPPPPA